MAAVLPRPGVALGAYPQRSELDPPGWLLWWRAQGRLRAGLRAPAPLARRQGRRFAAAVRVAAQGLPYASEATLAARVQAVRALLAREGLADTHLAEAFALVGEAARRQLGLCPFDTQLIAARIMLRRQLAEMATGEGKTLAALLAAATAALAGIPVQMITANDYLVARDAQRLRPVYELLGLRVAFVTQPMAREERAAAYRADVTYCTARELVFDYLRDHLGDASRGDLQRRAAALAGGACARTQPLLPGLCLALIDEADGILIDEAMTPLILSQARIDADEVQACRQALRIAGLLKARRDYRLDLATRSAELTERGRQAVAEHGKRLGGAWAAHAREGAERVALALAARHLFQRDLHYLLREGQVLLIDETTGRVADGRVWSQGLQTLVELKEGCEPTGTPRTLAQITYQRFFPRYLQLGGMSGTLGESRAELMATYGLGVQAVPLRRASRRERAPTRLFLREADRWAAVVAEAARCHAAGRPVLIGTDSVADSERLAGLLAAAGVPHTVLNARHDAAEAEIVASAGERGRITVATNMAGRGTDIPVSDAVEALGGLHVLACQHNASPRIDRQLAGRSARQGQRGGVQRWLSLESALFAQWPGWQRMAAVLARWQGGCAVGTLADVLARWPQWRAERQQAAQRAGLLAADRQAERLLALGGPSE